MANSKGITWQYKAMGEDSSSQMVNVKSAGKTKGRVQRRKGQCDKSRAEVHQTAIHFGKKNQESRTSPLPQALMTG